MEKARSAVEEWVRNGMCCSKTCLNGLNGYLPLLKKSLVLKIYSKRECKSNSNKQKVLMWEWKGKTRI
jgi:hypothetical protein